MIKIEGTKEEVYVNPELIISYQLRLGYTNVDIYLYYNERYTELFFNRNLYNLIHIKDSIVKIEELKREWFRKNRIKEQEGFIEKLGKELSGITLYRDFSNLYELIDQEKKRSEKEHKLLKVKYRKLIG